MGSASNLQLYALASVQVNGQPLSEEASVTIDRTLNSQQVLTVAKGYAGESPGAAMCEISVDNAVPSVGFELNPSQYMANGKPQLCQFHVFAAGKVLTFNGFIISDNFAHAVNTESKLTFKARGSFSDWEDSSVI